MPKGSSLPLDCAVQLAGKKTEAQHLTMCGRERAPDGKNNSVEEKYKAEKLHDQQAASTAAAGGAVATGATKPRPRPRLANVKIHT